MIQFEKVRWTAGRFMLTADLQIGPGVTGIFGSSGAGKSTLLELIAGLRRVQAGRILIGGEVVDDAGARRHLRPEHRHIGYVPQDGALFPHLNVERNLRFGEARSGGGRGREAGAGAEIDRVCEVLGIAGLRRAEVAGLSGGERQRVALARALLSHPRLLLLDEPLAALDVSRKEMILPYLARVRQAFGLPMLYVSHAAEELVTLCDEVIVLEAGRVVDRGGPGEVFRAEPTQRYVRRPAGKNHP
jgi:molybdate transport system ATP-binding protein